MGTGNSIQRLNIIARSHDKRPQAITLRVMVWGHDTQLN